MVVLQCDENIERSLWKALTARGLIVRRVEEENLKGIDDIKLLDYCRKKERILLTNDADFFLLANSGEHNGIIFLTDQRAPLPEIVRSILFLLQTLTEKEFQNSIFYVPFRYI